MRGVGRNAGPLFSDEVPQDRLPILCQGGEIGHRAHELLVNRFTVGLEGAFGTAYGIAHDARLFVEGADRTAQGSPRR